MLYLEMKKKEGKMEAVSAARELLELAVRNSGSNLPLAKKQVSLARKLLLRFNIRFGWELKRYYCHGCKQLIVPGVNARVRLGHRGTVIRMTCRECGYVNRKVVSRARLNI